MKIKLTLAALLFLLPFNIYGSKGNKKSKIENENLPDIDVFDGLEHDDKTSRPAVRTVARRYSGGHHDLQRFKTLISPSNVAQNANPGTVLETAHPEDSKTPPIC